MAKDKASKRRGNTDITFMDWSPPSWYSISSTLVESRTGYRVLDKYPRQASKPLPEALRKIRLTADQVLYRSQIERHSIKTMEPSYETNFHASRLFARYASGTTRTYPPENRHAKRYSLSYNRQQPKSASMQKVCHTSNLYDRHRLKCLQALNLV
jgi:hypothetical protein